MGKKEIKKKTKKEKLPQLAVSLEEMLEAGCHFGHAVAKTHPHIRPYLYTARDGIQIFDLIQTRDHLQKAAEFLYQLAKENKPVLLVGTKRQARRVVRRVAEETQSPWVAERWLGGTLTNWEEIYKRIELLRKLRQDWEKGVYRKRTKKEQAVIRHQLSRLERFFGGLESLKKLPAALVVVDIKREITAVREARVKKIPVVALVDSNADPQLVDYPIPANDDAFKSINLLLGELGRWIALGKVIKVKREKGGRNEPKSKK